MEHRRNERSVLHSCDLNQVCIKVGSWTCPSGNSVDVFLEQDDTGRCHAWYIWDEPPPLLPQDQRYYIAVIQPEVTRLARELCGFTGPILAVTFK